MNVQIVRNNEIFLYDAQIHGYDTSIIKALAGTPAISSNKLRLNAAEITTYSFFRNASVQFAMTIPTAPTSGDVREFGFNNPSAGNNARVEFVISGTTVTAVAYDATGTLIASVPITWNSAWTNTETRYRISLTERMAVFAVNDTIVATIEGAMPKVPMFVHLEQDNADNLDLAQIAVY